MPRSAFTPHLSGCGHPADKHGGSFLFKVGLFWAVLLGALSAPLIFSEEKHVVINKTEVEALYWHEGSRYTVAITGSDGKVSMESLPRGGVVKINLFTDLSEGEKPWYSCDYKWGGGKGYAHDGWCEIHIGSLDEMNTGDWNHGKFGRGTTTRID